MSINSSNGIKYCNLIYFVIYFYHIIFLPDMHGIYHFNEMGHENLPACLGYLIGYISGPLSPETSEEEQQRLKDVMTLREI